MCRRGDAPPVDRLDVRPGDPRHGGPRRRPRGRPPAGHPGEVLVRGFNVMRGYFEDPRDHGRGDHRRTAGSAPATWASSTTAGNLRITDRIKDMFIVGGFNAYPAEIEQLLGLHPDMADVAVVGVPDPRLGEVGKAYAVRRPGATLTADDLIAWSRREMANYKVPRAVEFVGGAAAERERQGGEGGAAGAGVAQVCSASPDGVKSRGRHREPAVWS